MACRARCAWVQVAVADAVCDLMQRRMREEEEERRRREEQEARERREREAQAQAQAQTQGPPAQEPAQERREEVAAAAHAAESAQASAPPPEPPKAVSIPSDDPILRAMQQAALARPETGGADPEPPKPAPAPAAPMRLQPVKPQWGVRAGGAAAAKRPGGGLQGVFGEEEDSRPKLSAPLPAPASVPSAPAPAPTPAPAGKEALRELASRIPSTWQGLLAYDVDWAAYDGMSGDSRVRQQLLSWVSKKIREYLGADEPSLAEFIMGKVGEHAGPAEMHDFMKDVLDSGEFIGGRRGGEAQRGHFAVASRSRPLAQTPRPFCSSSTARSSTRRSSGRRRRRRRAGPRSRDGLQPCLKPTPKSASGSRPCQANRAWALLGHR